VASATTEELEKEFGSVHATLNNKETNYIEGVFKLVIIHKELNNREEQTDIRIIGAEPSNLTLILYSVSPST